MTSTPPVKAGSPKSQHMNVTQMIASINKMDTVEAVTAAMQGEDRRTVLDAAEARIKKLRALPTGGSTDSNTDSSGLFPEAGATDRTEGQGVGATSPEGTESQDEEAGTNAATSDDTEDQNEDQDPEPDVQDATDTAQLPAAPLPVAKKQEPVAAPREPVRTEPVERRTGLIAARPRAERDLDPSNPAAKTPVAGSGGYVITGASENSNGKIFFQGQSYMRAELAKDAAMLKKLHELGCRAVRKL